ncbi:MAG: tyrosine-type recombinase/integrase [Phascolarctobacterium sp.]
MLMPVYKYEDSKHRVRWLASFYYYDAFKKRHHTTKRGFLHERDAKKYEHDFLANQTQDPTILLKDLVVEYLNYLKPRRKPSTYDNKCYLLKKHILPILGHMEIKDISPKVIIKWQNILSKNNYKPSYLYQLCTLLGGLLAYGMKTQGLRTNAMWQTGKIGKARTVRNNTWTLDNFQTFIQTLANDEYNRSKQIKRMVDTDSLIVAYHILFFTGIRLGELLALTSDDINFKSNTIVINKSFQRLHQRDIISEPKTPSSIRIVDLPDKVMHLLHEYIRKLPPDYPSDARIFFNLGKNNLGRPLKSTAKLAGVPEICIHDLRHSHATLLYTLGVSAKEASIRLGHAKIQTTLDVYTHISHAGQSIATQLDNLIK